MCLACLVRGESNFWLPLRPEGPLGPFCDGWLGAFGGIKEVAESSIEGITEGFTEGVLQFGASSAAQVELPQGSPAMLSRRALLPARRCRTTLEEQEPKVEDAEAALGFVEGAELMRAFLLDQADAEEGNPGEPGDPGGPGGPDPGGPDGPSPTRRPGDACPASAVSPRAQLAIPPRRSGSNSQLGLPRQARASFSSAVSSAVSSHDADDEGEVLRWGAGDESAESSADSADSACGHLEAVNSLIQSSEKSLEQALQALHTFGPNDDNDEVFWEIQKREQELSSMPAKQLPLSQIRHRPHWLDVLEHKIVHQAVVTDVAAGAFTGQARSLADAGHGGTDPLGVFRGFSGTRVFSAAIE